MVHAHILPDILEAKACTGKVQHTSRGAAKKAMLNFAKNKCDGYVGDLNTYRCKFCDKYHFGHKSKLLEQFEIPT